jgi:hypothetical protein
MLCLEKLPYIYSCGETILVKEVSHLFLDLITERTILLPLFCRWSAVHAKFAICSTGTFGRIGLGQPVQNSENKQRRSNCTRNAMDGAVAQGVPCALSMSMPFWLIDYLMQLRGLLQSVTHVQTFGLLASSSPVLERNARWGYGEKDDRLMCIRCRIFLPSSVKWFLVQSFPASFGQIVWPAMEGKLRFGCIEECAGTCFVASPTGSGSKVHWPQCCVSTKTWTYTRHNAVFPQRLRLPDTQTYPDRTTSWYSCWLFFSTYWAFLFASLHFSEN